MLTLVLDSNLDCEPMEGQFSGLLISVPPGDSRDDQTETAGLPGRDRASHHVKARRGLSPQRQLWCPSISSHDHDDDSIQPLAAGPTLPHLKHVVPESSNILQLGMSQASKKNTFSLVFLVMSERK